MTAAAVNWSDEERLAWTPKEELSISAWAEKYVVLSSRSEEKGPFRMRRVPYLAPILNEVLNPHTERIVVCKPAQIALTTGAQILVGYFGTTESCPIGFCLADEKTSEFICYERMGEMLRESVQLSEYVDYINRDEIKFKTGSHVTMIWASSVENLGSREIKIMILDEIDKPGYYRTTKEASAISLAIERTESFYTRKIFMMSTPTIETGNVTAEIESCDVVYDFHVPCPFCQTLQPLRWSLKYAWGFDGGQYRGEDGQMHKLGEIRWKGGTDATQEEIEAAGYECGTCGKLWDTIQKNAAVEQGRMVARELPEHPPRKVGFHLNRLYSLLGKSGDISKLVADFIDAVRSGDPKKLQGFINSALAEPWRQTVVKTEEAEILKARCTLPAQTVPVDAIALTCGIDMQKIGFWFTVRAWARDFRSWLIHYGFLPTWDSVESLLFETSYPIDTKDGLTMPIWRAGLDTGGGKGQTDLDPTLTEQAYYWLRKNGAGRGCQCFGTKGASHPLAGKVHAGKRLDQTPSGKAIPGGLQIILLDTDAWKNAYHYRLRQAIDGGAMGAYLHADVGVDYAKQIMAEELRINQKGLQEWVRVNPSNHLLDAELLAMAVADPEWPGGGVNILSIVKDKETEKRRAAAVRSRVLEEREPGGRPGWMERRR
jgi:phage terminase large subunit GpA-like protein